MMFKAFKKKHTLIVDDHFPNYLMAILGYTCRFKSIWQWPVGRGGRMCDGVGWVW